MSRTLRLMADVDRSASGLSLGHYAILGFLYQQPMHGYEIARRFREESELGLVLPLDMNVVYALLKDLYVQGLVEGHQEAVGLRPLRTVYRLTPLAETRLLRWLEEPVERLREIRAGFMAKLYFCNAIGISATTRLLDAQLPASHAYLAQLLERASEPEAGAFARFVYRSKISAARATIAWMEEERAALEV